MTNFLIIISNKDLAGINIKSQLLKLVEWRESGDKYVHKNLTLLTLSKDTISSDNLGGDVDICIFATRHQSKEGVHSLSVHAPGNWGSADYGGREKTLCIAPAGYMKLALCSLKELAADKEYRITVEQTHHGPVMQTPCMFIEIGSSKEQWQDEKSGEIIAKVILRITAEEPKYKSLVILGGGHYNMAANKLMLSSEYAVGHICSKHNLPALDEKMLMQAIQKTTPKPEIIALDWKGLGAFKKQVQEICEKIGIKSVRAKNLL